MTLTDAIAAYLAREAEDMRKPEGADCKALIAQVAGEFGMTPAALSTAVIDETIKRFN